MNRRRLLPLVLSLIVLSALISPFGRELYVGDETKYGEVIRDMRSAHVFFVPILNGEPFSHKPPVHFWMVDALTHIAGLYSLWSFVIPSLVGFAALLLVMVRMTREMLGGEGAFWSAIVTGSSLLTWGSAQTARMDVTFTLALTAGIWLLFRFLRDDDFHALLAAAILLAVATLIKGPMAPIIALVLIALEWARSRRLPRGNYLPAIAATIVLPLLWVVPAVIMRGNAFAREILVKQTVGRAISTWVHRAPPWFYLARSPLTLFPWFFLFAGAVFALIRAERDRFRRPADPLWFSLDWVIAVVLPYSLMSSKLDVYMMAAIPPVAVLTAWLVATAGDAGPASADALASPRSGAAAASAAVGGGRDSPVGVIALRTATRFAIAGNVLTLLVLASCGVALLVARDRLLHGPDAALFPAGRVRAVAVGFAVTAVVGLVAIFRSDRRRLERSLLALTAAVIVPLVIAIAMLLDPINAVASSTPLIKVLQRQPVPPESIALYSCPNLWSRDFPRQLERVRYVGPDVRDSSGRWPLIVATARAHASEIAPALSRYRQIDEVRMIGKWFDVYRLRNAD
jgi:4-amino-4-deoxy-L-arabinose transferase-like glycosyltransferase